MCIVRVERRCQVPHICVSAHAGIDSEVWLSSAPDALIAAAVVAHGSTVARGVEMGIRALSVVAVVCLIAACDTGGQEPIVSAERAATLPLNDPRLIVPREEITPGSAEEFFALAGDRVFFIVDKYDLTEAARETLQRQAAWLQRHPSRRIVVQGHADERGTREYNLALGDLRANAVRNYLIAVGINPDRVSTVSYGKEHPAATGATETAWAQNRRGVTLIE